MKIINDHEVIDNKIPLHHNLIGKMIGTDVNPTITLVYSGLVSGPFQVGEQIIAMTINYNTLVGGPFAPGAIITNTDNGTTAIVITDNGSTLRVRTMMGGGGFFDGEHFNDGLGNSAIVNGDYTRTLGVPLSIGSGFITVGYLVSITNPPTKFLSGEIIYGDTSGAHATVTTFTNPDQNIPLFGGIKFVITDVVVTNASIALDKANGGEFWSGPNRTGKKLLTTNVHGTTYTYGGGPPNPDERFQELVIPENVISGLDIICWPPPCTTQTVITSGVYFSLCSPQEATATVDIYIYGYVLEV